MAAMKWPNGIPTCPKCGGDKIGGIKSRRKYQCKAKGCRCQFSSKTDTIFEDSPLGLDKWFVAVWSITNAKNGISSCELARDLGVTQKTGWFMLHRVRAAMATGSFRKIVGEIEADESFIGGKRRNKHRDKKGTPNTGFSGMAAVHGILQRGGDIRAAVVSDVKKPTLQRRVRDHVEPGAVRFIPMPI